MSHLKAIHSALGLDSNVYFLFTIKEIPKINYNQCKYG